MADDNITEDTLRNYVISKRPAERLPVRPNDVYVCCDTRFAAQVARAQRLLDSGWPEIFVHGLGAAIHRAVNLALQLQLKSKGSLALHTETSTVTLIDDLEPIAEGSHGRTRVRNNSAVHIRVYRTGTGGGAHVPKLPK